MQHTFYSDYITQQLNLFSFSNSNKLLKFSVIIGLDYILKNYGSSPTPSQLSDLIKKIKS